MSSPARSSVSGGGGGGGGSNAGYGEDVLGYPFYPDIIAALDRKDEALAALKSDLMAALQKEVKSLDEDAWKFAGPRSQIHLISRRATILGCFWQLVSAMQAKVLASILWIPFCSDLSGYMESAISVGVAVTIVPTRSRFESTCEPLNPRPVETNRQWPTKERQKERPRPETLVLVCLRTPFSSPPSESVAMSVKTVKISNVSLRASERDIKEFFSFSGDIEYVEMQKGDESSQAAYVTFKDTQGAETSMLLTGATIVDLSVVITPAPDYELPPEAAAAIASAAKDANAVPGGESVIQKAESVVTTMLAKGFVLGKDAVGKAKTFDEKHQLTSTATSKVSALNQKIGFTEKISMGASAVNEKVLEMDSKFQVTEKARSAVAAAEQKVGNASSAIMKNRYVFTSAAWVSGAFNKVAKAASEVGSKAMEKVVASEPESNKDLEDEVAKVHISETSPVASQEPPRKPEPAQGLVL